MLQGNAAALLAGVDYERFRTHATGVAKVCNFGDVSDAFEIWFFGGVTCKGVFIWYAQKLCRNEAVYVNVRIKRVGQFTFPKEP